MGFFHYQIQGKESKWDLARSEERQAVLEKHRPAFTTVLDLSHVPEAGGDWAKVLYTGPLYFDFDADGDLDLACTQVKSFIGKLSAEQSFDVEQARYYASGSKGFHIEIPQACVMPKVQATAWLPYIYREIAQQLIVDTLDLNVYTGKKGRQWRTPGVERENGCFKVPLTLEEVMHITPEDYLEVIKAPRTVPDPTPPSVNAHLSMLFTQARDKVTAHARGRKKRQDKANEMLDPWRKAGRIMPSIERLMRGQVRDGVGFQRVAMQLAIYASSVGMEEAEFLKRCEGLVENHVSDGYRYRTPAKRREELSRMLAYMAENTLYDFEPDPLLAMQPAGADTADLGRLPEDVEDKPEPKAAAPDTDPDVDPVPDTGSDPEQGDAPEIDLMAGVSAGVFQTVGGISAKRGDEVKPLTRLRFTKVLKLVDLESKQGLGYEVSVVAPGTTRSVTIHPDTFASVASMRKFAGGFLCSYQGTDAETAGMIEMLNNRSGGETVYTIPREGFMVLPHPQKTNERLLVYLTQKRFMTSDPGSNLRLRYKPTQAESAYKIDIDEAVELNDSHIPFIHDLLTINRPDVLADMLGWFVAAFYRSCYIETMQQFPLMQVFGDAGSGKTQTVKLLAHLHWCRTSEISVKSAGSMTNFAADSNIGSSTSAPLIIDEYKPREMKAKKGNHEKLKELFKASYTQGDVGDRGTVNKGADNPLSLIKSKATAPVVFLGEAIESETAIVERSVAVALSATFKTQERTDAFLRLQANPEALSAIGRDLLVRGLAIDLKAMQRQVCDLRDSIRASLPLNAEGRPNMPDRMIFNRAVVLHGLKILKDLLHDRFGEEFDAGVDKLINGQEAAVGSGAADIALHSMTEISKVMNRLALLSRVQDRPFSLLPGKAYCKGDTWVEVMIEASYDAYRTYCASVHERPLFDTLEAFVAALHVYAPVTDKLCAGTMLRADDSDERVYRFDVKKLKAAGVGQFRG